jgi:hypothetical protein
MYGYDIVKDDKGPELGVYPELPEDIQEQAVETFGTASVEGLDALCRKCHGRVVFSEDFTESEMRRLHMLLNL